MSRKTIKLLERISNEWRKTKTNVFKTDDQRKEKEKFPGKAREVKAKTRQKCEERENAGDQDAISSIMHLIGREYTNHKEKWSKD